MTISKGIELEILFIHCDPFIDFSLSSDRMVDEQISVAINMKENLQNQHYNLRDISRKINTITSE